MLALALVMLMWTGSVSAYSVLTHEEIVDLLWTDQIRLLILKRFPGLSEEQLKEAHAYAYGGAVIQDLGYYPFGSVEFSNLVHYVRTGDFVRELLAQSSDADEYAFALGALAHYVSDIDGHPAVNQAVAIQYPKLRAKYGNSVEYVQNKTAHLKTEFGFDMVQVAKQRYAPQQYHDFIGFQVSKPLLERVFPIVYGLKLSAVLPHADLTISSYRYSVSRMIPELTQVALQTHKKDMQQEEPNFNKRKFLYRLSRADYQRDWGSNYTKPGFGTRVLSTLLRYVPKVGPFRAMAFNNPTPQTENLYFKSINATVDQYRALVLEGSRDAPLMLPNCDLDSGEVTKEGEYSLADEAYSKLMTQLAEGKFDHTTPELRDNILQFYSDIPAVSAAAPRQDDKIRSASTLALIDRLRTATPVPGLPGGGQ